MSRSCTCCAHWRTDGFCVSVTRPYKIAWMFLWNGLHTVQLLCVHTSKVSEQFSEINRILSGLSFYGIWFCIFTSSKKKNMKHSLQLWQRIRGLIKDHYRVAFCQLLFESRVSQIFYYLKYVVWNFNSNSNCVNCRLMVNLVKYLLLNFVPVGDRCRIITTKS